MLFASAAPCFPQLFCEEPLLPKALAARLFSCAAAIYRLDPGALLPAHAFLQRLCQTEIIQGFSPDLSFMTHKKRDDRIASLFV